MARRTDADGARALAGQRSIEVLTRRDDGALLALISDKWRLAQVKREHPDIMLEPLIAGSAGGARRPARHCPRGHQPWRAPSIWSKSPTPLLTPPPPDHCHISAYRLSWSGRRRTARTRRTSGTSRSGRCRSSSSRVRRSTRRCSGSRPAPGTEDRRPDPGRGVDADLVLRVRREIRGEPVEVGAVHGRGHAAGLDDAAARRGVDGVPAVVGGGPDAGQLDVRPDHGVVEGPVGDVTSARAACRAPHALASAAVPL